MKNSIIQTQEFKRDISFYLKKRLLLQDDFDEFKDVLTDNPEMGDLVPGAGGVRKARLKSASRGKSGGFRVCYYYVSSAYEIFLLMIYAKNDQEDLTPTDKKILKATAKIIDGEKP
jgi:mRNA-degrading endonuclease RelE of RelBE toxin-antitoxin system